MNLFQLGNFVLNSGAHSTWKIECDAFTDQDWATLAEMVHQMVGPFSSVEGVPRGGLKLAKSLEPLAEGTGPLLIVDDVLTTGGSMERLRQERIDFETVGKPLPRFQNRPMIVGAVVFARGMCPHWVHAIFQMPQCFWVKPR